MIISFVQARMSSTRLPGKVLLPFQGSTILGKTIENIERARIGKKTIVLTSTDRSDDLIFDYCIKNGFECFRGSLDNVYERFLRACEYYGCDRFVRVCADSPFTSPSLIEFMVSCISDRSDIDICTNILDRTFPSGQSVEVVNSVTFANIATLYSLCNFEKEHITQVFYNNLEKFKIFNITTKEKFKVKDLAVDTFQDYVRLNNTNPLELDLSKIIIKHEGGLL